MTAPPWLLGPPLAHRGLHRAASGVPENSIAAFDAAAVAGVGIELDVHRSRDGHAVVVHDDHLGRLTGHDVHVHDLDLDQLGSLRLWGGDHHIPTLRAVLDAVAGRVGVMVELKTVRAGAVGALEEAVAAVLDTYAGPVCVASFNPLTVGWFERNRPDVVRVQTVAATAGGLPAWLLAPLGGMPFNRWTRPDVVSYQLAALPHPAVEAWRQAGGVVVTWTVRTPSERRRALELADNYLFEEPLGPPGAA